ncbi:MAG: gluconate permease [Rhodopirellula sp.]|nr:gluconate permease [Rhodopirellula sp.]
MTQSIPPLLILGVGILTVIGMILVLRVNAFLALITAALLVSFLSPLETSAPGGVVLNQVERVAAALGDVAGKIGIVIALAAIIGKCMMDSGAADRIVRACLGLLGEKRAPAALLMSGYILGVPVFFDTVFYLLVPLARSLWKQTRRNYVMYILAIAAGGVITHTLVPPTPGPLLMAEILNIDLGTMIVVGGLIGIPTAVVGLIASRLLDRWLALPMRPLPGEMSAEPLDDAHLPPLLVSALPIFLPVLLISGNTVAKTVADSSPGEAWSTAAGVMALVGNANFALLLSAAVAMATLVRQRGLKLTQLAQATEEALMSGGVIILITAAGGAFGAMLRVAGVGSAIQQSLGEGGQATGLVLLATGFIVASVMKVAQGSGTVSMITTAGMLAAMNPTPEVLGFHPVYLATAIGSGSVVGSWMNDSGFWVVARMSGFTEVETLKSWTVVLVLLGLTGFGLSMLLATTLPLV